MMAKSIRVGMAATFAVAMFTASSASAWPKAATTPSDKCEAGKNEVAGKYVECLGRAERRFIIAGDATVYGEALARCVSRFERAWAKLETATAARGATCPSEDDGPAITDFLDTCSGSVAEALAGGSLPDPAQCLTDLTECEDGLAASEADLATCSADLGVCTADLTTCTADLTATQGSLDTCNTDLGTCNTDLGTCNADLSTCSTDLGTCNADLTATQGDLDTCNADLGTCDADLGTCNADLGTCNTDLGTCNTDLSTCNTDLGTCNTDLTATQGDLDTCNTDLGACNTDLGTCTTDLGTCNTDLGTCNTDLGTCNTDLAACEAVPVGQPLKSGQTICYDPAGGTTPVSCTGTGQDGEFTMGAARAYTDNGDGTITDETTGLMWEKLSDDGSIHDKDTTYTWPNAFATKIAALNTAVFADHSDWRLPNRFELETLTDLSRDAPATNETFHSASCLPGCTVTTCNCTRSNFYWTSTTYKQIPENAWIVGFAVGNSSSNGKTSLYFVRAVRGGS